MTQSEFIKKVMHKPWVNRASSFDECDCFGLVMLYYKHVLNIDLQAVQGYDDKVDTAECWTNEISNWEAVQTPSVNGLVFTCYRGERPMHVGVVISPTHVLHCRGSEGNHGKVEIHSIRAIQRLYGRITYHQLKQPS